MSGRIRHGMSKKRSELTEKGTLGSSSRVRYVGRVCDSGTSKGIVEMNRIECIRIA
jgi:hypothetical protein